LAKLKEHKLITEKEMLTGVDDLWPGLGKYGKISHDMVAAE
jgi:hypothetical protein